MSGWIDFKELRKQLDFESVLKHYGVEVKRKGDQHHGFCPLPDHNGKRNSASFSANLTRGIFQCFGCGAKGNVLEFAALMERVNIEDGVAFRKVADGLRQKFCPGLRSQREAAGASPKPAPATPTPEQRNPVLAKGAVAIVNAPLDFELKGLDATHPYLFSRGFTPETIAHFGLGFCSRGLLKDRVAIPLLDYNGRLIGYAGRVVDDTVVNVDNPRYRFPSARKREGKVYEFRKTQFLYNGHRIGAPVDDLFVVEGFTGVWWLVQNGMPDVVATMGADCSERQVELIVSLVKPGGRVWLIPDGDAAGTRFAESLLRQISSHRFVRWVKLEAGKQPTDHTGDELRTFLGKGTG